MPARWFLDVEGRLRLAWRILIFGAGMLAIQGGAAIGVGLIVVIAMLVQGEQFDLQPGAETAILEKWTLTLMIIAAPFITGATTLQAAAMRKWLDRRSVRSLGLPFPISQPASRLLGGTLAGAAPIVLIAGILVVLGGFDLAEPTAEWLAIPLIVTLVLMAFYEEIVFRGYLLRNFLDAGRPVVGVAFTSILFWLAHSLNPNAWASPWSSVNLLGAGVFLALIYLATNELWTPTAVHFGWNAAQGVLLDIPVSGMETPGWIGVDVDPDHPEWLTGGEFGLEGSALTSLVLLVLIAVMLPVVKTRQRRWQQAAPPTKEVPPPAIAEDADDVYLAEPVEPQGNDRDEPA